MKDLGSGVEPFSGRERAAPAASGNPLALTPLGRLNLTLGEESCYILEVPRVKIGLPVYSLSSLVVCDGGEELSVAAFALTGGG